MSLLLLRLACWWRKGKGLVREILEKIGWKWTGRGVKQERGARIGSVSFESCCPDTVLYLLPAQAVSYGRCCSRRRSLYEMMIQPEVSVDGRLSG